MAIRGMGISKIVKDTPILFCIGLTMKKLDGIIRGYNVFRYKGIDIALKNNIACASQE